MCAILTSLTFLCYRRAASHCSSTRMSSKSMGLWGSWQNQNRDCLLWDKDKSSCTWEYKYTNSNTQIQCVFTCTWENCTPPNGGREGGKLPQNSCLTGFCLGYNSFNVLLGVKILQNIQKKAPVVIWQVEAHSPPVTCSSSSCVRIFQRIQQK